MSVQHWLELLDNAECFDLTHPWHEGMPGWAEPFHYWMHYRHGDVMKQPGVSLATDAAFWPMHVGTHVDALGHYSENHRLFSGIEVSQAQSGNGLAQCNAEEIPLRFEHALVLDARELPLERPLTVADIEGLCQRQKIQPATDDVLLIATGWDRYWPDPAVYLGKNGWIPGLDPEVMDFAHGEGIKAVGTDTALVEFWPNQGELHRRALARFGIWLIENLVLSPLCQASVAEVVLCVFPVVVRGATGAPARIVALAPKRGSAPLR